MKLLFRVPFSIFSWINFSLVCIIQKGRSLILCVVVSAWAPIHQCLLAFEARWWGVSRLIIDQFWSTRSADKKRTLYFDKRSTWSRKSPLLCPLIFQTLLPVDFAPKSGSRVLIEPWEILSTCFVIFVEPEIYWNWSFTWWSSSWKILVTFVCVSADFLHRNPFKNPDKKGSWKSTNSSRLNIFQNFQSSFYYCYNICKMNASLKPFYMQKIGDVLTNFLCCWCKKKVLYRCYLAVEQFVNKKETIYDQPPLEKANLKFETVFNIHAYV